MYVINFTKYQFCCLSWGVEVCIHQCKLDSEPDFQNMNCICSCHKLVKINSCMPMSVKYANIKMYVPEITLNAIGTAQTTRQGRNHAESHQAHDAHEPYVECWKGCKSMSKVAAFYCNFLHSPLFYDRHNNIEILYHFNCRFSHVSQPVVNWT